MPNFIHGKNPALLSMSHPACLMTGSLFHGSLKSPYNCVGFHLQKRNNQPSFFFSLLNSIWRLHGGGVQAQGVFLGKPEDSGWEDWGTLGKIRGITTPPKRILFSLHHSWLLLLKPCSTYTSVIHIFLNTS